MRKLTFLLWIFFSFNSYASNCSSLLLSGASGVQIATCAASEKANEDAENKAFIFNIGLLILFGFICAGLVVKRQNEKKLKVRQQSEQIDLLKQLVGKDASVQFEGRKELTDDGYKIYLTKKYGIEKNEALGKFICTNRLFDSIEEALEFANQQESLVAEKPVDYQNSVPPQSTAKSKLPSYIIACLVVVVVVVILALVFNSKKEVGVAQLKTGKLPPTFNSVYVDYDNKLFGLASGAATQDRADKLAKNTCQTQSGAVKCEKVYGDELKCVAFAYSPTSGASGVGTANTIELAQSTALKFCKESSKESGLDCAVSSAYGAVCAKN